jgi:4-hydroxy-tetrahydrodipicolinate synthase
MKGLGTALITPFLENGEIDYVALDRLIDHQLTGSTDYLVILGTTSEVPALTIAEQDAIISHVIRKVAGRIPLVMGIGGNCTAAVIERIHELKDILI